MHAAWIDLTILLVMPSMIIALYVYLGVLSLVAIYLGRYIASKIDMYDWRFRKGQILADFAFACLLWPLLILKPQNILHPDLLFAAGRYDIAARAARLDRLRNDPPRCGSVVCYKQRHARHAETFGEFYFPATAVAYALAMRLQECPDLARTSEEGSILNWVMSRTEEPNIVTEVPREWWEFQFVADALIRDGQGTVRCIKCCESYPTGNLIPRDDSRPQGWSFDRLYCPKGHPILFVERAHVIRAAR